MTAVGYTSGDPRKVDVAGDTMTGDLVLPADPDQPLEAATKQYVDNSGGGGGGTPSGTVVSETSFGQASTAGAAGTFSRGDHTHGSPAAPTAASVGADPTGSAATAQANAIASAAASLSVHEADTTNVHGIANTAALVTTARTISTTAPLQGGGDLSANRTLSVDVGTGAGQVAAGNHTHAGTPRIADSGFIAGSNNISVPDSTWTDVGFVDLSIPAVSGDRIVLHANFMCDTAGSDIVFDAVTRVSAANNRYFSSGTTTQRSPGGLGSWYVESGRFIGVTAPAILTVDVTDIDAGEVTVRFIAKSESGSRTVRRNDVFPMRWWIINEGQPA